MTICYETKKHRETIKIIIDELHLRQIGVKNASEYNGIWYDCTIKIKVKSYYANY